MKKFFFVLSVVFTVGISSLLFFTSADKKFSFLVQPFLPEKASPQSILLVSADDESFDFIESSEIQPSQLKEAFQSAMELGARSVLCDFNYKGPLKNIDYMVKKVEGPVEKKAPLFNFKIVIPSKKISDRDSKSPGIEGGLFPFDFPSADKEKLFLGGNIYSSNLPYSRHIFVKKGDEYLGDMNILSLLKLYGPVQICISDSSILLENLKADEGQDISPVNIPRANDGSILLKYPKKSWHDYRSLSLLHFFELKSLEDNLYSYMKVMESRGLFGEMNSESPLSLYEKVLLEKDRKNDSAYFSMKEKFYVLMAAYLSGNQERVLLEATSDKGKQTIISNSFATCRKIFSNLETVRTKISAETNGAVCYFALTSKKLGNFMSSPYEDDFPEALASYVLAKMILAGDFIPEYPKLIFSIASGILLFSILLLSHHIVKKSSRKKILTANFNDKINRKILTKSENHADGLLRGQKNLSSLLASSIYDFTSLSALLNENQLTSFLNYYYDKVAFVLTKNGGIIESSRNDEIISLFGSPIEDANLFNHTLKAAFELKEIDYEINADIDSYPQSPKPDGMDPDLYTVFFILNHNKKRISLVSGIYSGQLVSGGVGYQDKKTYRILDDSWKKALTIKDSAVKINPSAIIANECLCEGVRDDYIIRKMPRIINDYILGDDLCSEIMAPLASDDDKLWNYVNFWNQAVEMLDRGENEKALSVFLKLGEGRPSDRSAKYLIKLLNRIK
ncbi:MAG: hypothetical protein K5873_07390 [Treponema sp.]|nr:hypothetical protein [Treponema sp.]